MRFNKRLIAILCVSVAALTVLVGLGYAGIFNVIPFTGTTVHFTVIEDTSGLNKGMNGSAYYPFSTPWPVIQVKQGERVIIHVMNNSTSETHGFAIVHYFPSGVSVTAGQSYNVEFIANDAGNFTIYCNTVCSIHPFMQNGRLVVT